jgi:GTP-binding protein
MIEGYLKGREELRAIVLLLDIRHKPNENDLIMHGFVKHYGYNMITVATKADKISRGKIQPHIADIRKTLRLSENEPIIPFSSETKQGRDELWAAIFEYTKGEVE